MRSRFGSAADEAETAAFHKSEILKGIWLMRFAALCSDTLTPAGNDPDCLAGLRPDRLLFLWNPAPVPARPMRKTPLKLRRV